MPECTSNRDTEGWERLYMEAKENGERRVSIGSRAVKRQKRWDDVDCQIHDCNARYFKDTTLTTDSGTGNVPLHELPENQSIFDYWMSTEATKLFRPKNDEPVMDALDRRIELFSKAISTPGVYVLLLPGKGDPENLYSDYEKQVVQGKATALRVAYIWMGQGITWEYCCDVASDMLLNVLGAEVSSYTIQKWNRQFRALEAFPHSNKFVATGIKKEPKVFELFPEAKG